MEDTTGQPVPGTGTNGYLSDAPSIPAIVPSELLSGRPTWGPQGLSQPRLSKGELLTHVTC